MKLYKIYFLALLATLSLGACSSDNDDNGGSNGKSLNQNANVVTAGVPQEVTRLEFPKIKGGTSTIIVHKTDEFGVNFCTEFDVAKKSQRWSCYAVYQSNNFKNWNRNNWRGASWQGKTWNGDPFQPDPAIAEAAQADIHDYNNSGYQRGHIVASEDRICNQDMNGQTFYMTNIQPQIGALNTGIWLKMEQKIQDFASRYVKTINDTMWVCKGGTIENGKVLAPTKAGNIVPKYFFAAVLVKNNSSYKAIGFWFEHKAYLASEKLIDHVVNIKKLEELADIDFFCNLPDDIEEKVENVNINAKYLQGLWNITN